MRPIDAFVCWWRRRQRDGDIDQLIALNRAKARPEMETVDWEKVARAGEQRWQETLRGQRRRG